MKRRALQLVPSPPPDSPDTVALTAVARGDVGALGGVYDRHAAALLRFAVRAGGRDEAEDLLQTTFLTVAKVASTYDGRAGNARAWLYGIMARHIQERRRALARFARAVVRATSPTSRAHDTRDSDRADLRQGLEKLAVAKRVVVVLAEVEGYTCEEIARMLEVPIGTVWTRLHHARKELRSFYEEDDR